MALALVGVCLSAYYYFYFSSAMNLICDIKWSSSTLRYRTSTLRGWFEVPYYLVERGMRKDLCSVKGHLCTVVKFFLGSLISDARQKIPH